jgi:WD40 repeat protein
LPPEIQNTLTGYWCYGQIGLTPEVLAHLVGDVLAVETVRDWTELVRYLPVAMLRPTDPSATHWHARLADYCEQRRGECRYARQWLVQHLLSSGQRQQAVEWLGDFEHTYQRLQLGAGQAGQIWQELLQLPEAERPAEWVAFWRGRQFLVDPHEEAGLMFLSLAEAYAQGSEISLRATEWLERQGPERAWLRLRFPPERPWSEPMLLQLPKVDHEWISQLLFSPDGNRLLTVTSSGQAQAWEVHSGRDLGRLELARAHYHWDREGLLALSGSDLFVLDPDHFQVLSQQRLPGEKPWGARFAAAGGRLVTSNSLRQVLVWDWRQQRSLAVLPPPERGLHELFLSRDGRRVTVLSEAEAHGCDLDLEGRPQRYHRNSLRPWSEAWAQGRVQLWKQQLRLAEGSVVLAAEVDEIWEWCSQDDWALFSEHGSWSLWNLKEGRRLARFGWPTPDEKVARDGRERYVSNGTVLGRSECVALDEGRQRALVWKLGASSAQVIGLAEDTAVELSGQRDSLVGGCLSADGRRAATVTKAGNLRVWDTHNGKCLRLLKGKAVAAALSADGSQALSGDAEGQVRLWEVGRGHCLTLFQGHSSAIEFLAFGEDGLMVSGDRECFQIWDRERRCLSRVARPPRLYARDLSPCGRYLYAERLGEDRWGRALLYDLDEGRVQVELPCPTAKPSGSIFSEDSRLLAVANQEGEFFQSCSLRLWQQDRLLESYRVPLNYNALALSERYLAASSQGHQVRIWERPGLAAPGHEASVLDLSADGRRVLSGSIDKTARLWDLENGQCLRLIDGHDRWVGVAQLCGPYAFCAGDLGGRLWDLESGQSQACEHLPLAANRQGEVLYGDGKGLWLWNPRQPGSKPVRVGSHPSFSCCAFSPEGNRVVSGSSSGALKLWDPVARRCLKTWATPVEGLRRLFWPSPQELVLEAEDGQRWSWDLESGGGAPLEAGLRLEFGTASYGKPLQVWRGEERLARWGFPIQRALVQSETCLVAARDSGEIHFLELMPPGATAHRPRLSRRAARPDPRVRTGGLQRTPLDRLEACQRILLVASGGRSDLLAAVPLAALLARPGRDIFLAAPLSGKKARLREVSAKGKAFENRLARLLERPLFAFPPEGTLPRLEVYRQLARELSLDALVLVEAGVETLLRGDEPSLGTAADDLVSLAAAQQLELPVKMLVNLGLGFDLAKGVCHAYTLERIAELTRSGGFWGSFSLLPGRPEFALLLEAAEFLGAGHPVHRLVEGLAGEFGGEAFANPLMNQFWGFDLDQVAGGCRVLEWLREKTSALDVHRTLTNYLTVTEARPWTEIPC